MATPAGPAQPAHPGSAPTMCLLHGDFHVMDQICWGTTLDFHFQHQGDMTQQEARDCYLAAVERKMLDNLLPALRPAASSRGLR
ncbi:hypothetical protein ACFV0T_26560 [Streptomyces sp. NPDC059582]|uniref:hypothetical protein n=1 Tax=Streptomyces sp. NPDC059582 TaxID=3346875 RepID=UPI003673974A